MKNECSVCQNRAMDVTERGRNTASTEEIISGGKKKNAFFDEPHPRIRILNEEDKNICSSGNIKLHSLTTAIFI